MNPAGHKKPGKQTAAVMESSPNTALENPWAALRYFRSRERIFSFISTECSKIQWRSRVSGLMDCPTFIIRSGWFMQILQYQRSTRTMLPFQMEMIS